MSFDFGKWCDWVAENVKEQPEGITAEFKFSEQYLPSWPLACEAARRWLNSEAGKTVWQTMRCS